MISIIIPVLNEASHIAEVLKHTLSLHGEFEIIVVDGGSNDATMQIVGSFPEVKTCISRKGRSHQMNAGAAMAKGEILLFLHADTFLPENSLLKIEAVMANKSLAGGSFFLKFDHKHWILSFYTGLSKINSSFFTYGDHAIFIRHSVFKKIKGYKPLSFMEDIEIQFRLKREGKFVKLPFGVVTSARRFVEAGPVKQFFLDVFLVGLYHIGFSANSLKRFYKDWNSSAKLKEQKHG
ncbi:TIGR04283 family arsenosugar biosynthesis glycosyltransferase [Zunongwangia sp. F363]|uniref:TIGR04283 family arsenosugar biosynthesis glycosyltransferase n=1 Tax=Autumnicola tepida TaxID=3075595 RepID=A0ABU3C7B9_9FLAO|nr:TIGR04283 family arsenosugar biosynthesis glycosyltransferase [Zunongwangia sp. F363]MDT0642229.1 TIGR04283 family arsenosugar biosynthesis glycosyltransferase [Zunongwangia sp. F363]